MVAVMTDTNSGITVQEGRENGFYVLPMPVIIDDHCYMEGVDITQEQLYEALKADRAVHTSQPAPGEMTDLWNRILAEGADEIVYIPMSSGLSSSCRTAAAIARDYAGKVHVVDNHRISVTQRASVYDALYLARQGKTGEEIKKSLEKNAFDASIYLCVTTLKYLKRSNRVTAAGASLAAAMNLRPVLNIRGGKLDAQCVVRSEKHAQKTLINLMENDLEKRFRFIPTEEISLSRRAPSSAPRLPPPGMSGYRRPFQPSGSNTGSSPAPLPAMWAMIPWQSPWRCAGGEEAPLPPVLRDTEKRRNVR